MTSKYKVSLADLGPDYVPLTSLSRSGSPHPAPNPSSDTDDDDYGMPSPASRRRFLSQERSNLTGWRRLLRGGGFGQWLFTTSSGRQFYIGVLVLWLGGCGIGLTIMNRIILWTGVYKFPYPLTTTLLEMLITHGLLLTSAFLTRLAGPWLISAGLSGMIAPSMPLKSINSPPRFRGQGKTSAVIGIVSHCISSGSGGIAGGGLFEFDWAIARQVVPVAVIFVAKVALSNLSFAYAQLPIYLLARTGIVPLSLIFTSFLGNTQHSVSILSAALTATLTLLVAAIRTNIRVTWESILAGIISSVFVALYPVQLQRTYKSLLASLVPQGELLSGLTPISSGPIDASGTLEESRAYWRLLHYTSLLSIIIFLPIVFLSGEISNISRNCYILDVFFHWLMVTCGGIGSWAVFFSTVALTRSTSPLTTSFLFIPRAAFMLPVMANFKMPAYSWIGIGMCWASCAWFLQRRRKEGRGLP